MLGDAKDDTGETRSPRYPPSGRSRCATCCRTPPGFRMGDSCRTTPGWIELTWPPAPSAGEPKTIAEQVERLGKVPLAHQPGEGWTYGLSHDVLGRLIEVVSGRVLMRTCKITSSSRSTCTTRRSSCPNPSGIAWRRSIVRMPQEN